MAANELIGTKEAAVFCGLDRRNVVRAVERNELTPALKLNGRTGAMLFRLSDVQAWKDRRTAERIGRGDDEPQDAA